MQNEETPSLRADKGVPLIT